MSDPAQSAEDYYQGFSLRVGLRDWLLPNARHEQLKLLVGDHLEGRDGLRILDVGCGTGVMTNHLRRYGDVTGVDFSRPAIELAESLVPDGRFHSGDVGRAALDGPFDLITLFDVVEHVPIDDREDFFARIRALLAPGGTLIASTPQPKHTRWLRESRPDRLQIVDEEVELADVVALADANGLELVRYCAYDVWERREYHAFFLETEDSPPDGALPQRRLERRLRMRANPLARVLRRLPAALRLLQHRRFALARWTVWPRGTPPELGRREGER